MATVKLVGQDIDQLDAPYADDMDSLGSEFSFDDDGSLESSMRVDETCSFNMRGHEWGRHPRIEGQWTKHTKSTSRWIRGEQRYE